MKRLLRSLLSLLAVAGIVLALWPLGQNAYALWSQHSLNAAWQQDSGAENPNLQHSTPPSKIAVPAANVNQSGVTLPSAPTQAAPAEAKWPATRLIIPSINIDVVVVQGWSDADLRQGPGHCPASVLPGEAGNCLIAGHRNVYGSYFYRLDELGTGAEIKLRTHHETYLYKVLYTTTVSDMDTTLLQPTGTAARLTLLTCTLPHTSNRIAVIAEMEAS